MPKTQIKLSGAIKAMQKAYSAPLPELDKKYKVKMEDSRIGELLSREQLNQALEVIRSQDTQTKDQFLKDIGPVLIHQANRVIHLIESLIKLGLDFPNRKPKLLEGVFLQKADLGNKILYSYLETKIGTYFYSYIDKATGKVCQMKFWSQDSKEDAFAKIRTRTECNFDNNEKLSKLVDIKGFRSHTNTEEGLERLETTLASLISSDYKEI